MQDENVSLIREVRSGNKNAFSKIVLRYDKKLYGFLFKIINDEHTAQDILQDTFIKIYKNIHKFDLNKPFLPWAFTIAHNTAMDYINKNKRISSFSLNDNDKTLNQSMFYHKSSSPEDIYEDNQFNLALSDTINRLPEKYKVLIILKYIEDLTYAQIASILNLPIHKIESRLYMARQKVIKNLEQTKKNECGKERGLIGLQKYT